MYKLTKVHQRPYPAMSPNGMKTYDDLITLIGVFSAPMNVGLCLFLVPFGREEWGIINKLVSLVVRICCGTTEF